MEGVFEKVVVMGYVLTVDQSGNAGTGATAGVETEAQPSAVQACLKEVWRVALVPSVGAAKAEMDARLGVEVHAAEGPSACHIPDERSCFLALEATHYLDRALYKATAVLTLRVGR